MATTHDSTCVQDIPRAERIARLNDALRTRGAGGQVVITRGVYALTGPDVTELIRLIAAYDDFDADNDPHGERDFGMVDFREREVMWKVDYYDIADLLFGSNDPANPDVTRRVLTIMLAEEY
jgi:hypothetical protein